MNERANEVVALVVRALDAAGVPHMLVGSLSSNVYGVERSTQDADFVIELGGRPVDPIVAALAPVVRVEPQVSFESVTLSPRYEAVHLPTGFGIELFMLQDDPFARARFARRVPRQLAGVTVYLPTAEDVVVQKLRWYVRAKRAKDREDLRQVLAVQHGHLDMGYVRGWCERHGALTVLDELLAQIADVVREVDRPA